MLKQLIQLFAEKFLTGKRAWIGQQSNLSDSVINYGIPTNFTKENENIYTSITYYTAPEDGFFISGIWYVYGNALSNLSKNEISCGKKWGNTTSSDYRAFIPCCKGDNIQLTIKTSNEPKNVDGYVRFIPKVGVSSST